MMPFSDWRWWNKLTNTNNIEAKFTCNINVLQFKSQHRTSTLGSSDASCLVHFTISLCKTCSTNDTFQWTHITFWNQLCLQYPTFSLVSQCVYYLIIQRLKSPAVKYSHFNNCFFLFVCFLHPTKQLIWLQRICRSWFLSFLTYSLFFWGSLGGVQKRLNRPESPEEAHRNGQGY